MEEKIVVAMQNLGLDENEAAVYLALLELGEANVASVSKKTGIRRTSVYPVLDRLVSLNLASQIKLKAKTNYIAEDPEAVLKLYRSRLDDFSGYVDYLKDIKGGYSKRPKVFFFDGAEGFKKIWKFIFASRSKEYLITTDPREMLGFVREGYITEKVIKEKIKKGIKSKQLVASSEYAKDIVAKDAKENRVSKILPHNYKLPFTKIVVDDKVALISPQSENIILLIESEALAKTERSTFEALWGLLPNA
jgi:sugar-specific transcriptional regulator TrmB